MKRLILVIIVLLSVPVSRATAAIAFGASLTCGSSTTTDFVCASNITPTGSNTLLVIAAEVASGTDILTAVKCGGTTLTLGTKVSWNGSTDWDYIYYALGVSGACAPEVTVSSSATIYIDAAYYTGVAQSAQPDQTGTCAVNSATCSVTVTSISTDWAVSYAGNGNVASFGTPTNLTSRQANSSWAGFAIYDSNGTVGSGAVTYTVQSNDGLAKQLVQSLVTFKVATGGTTATNCLALLGVGNGC